MNYNYSYNYNDIYGEMFSGMETFVPFLAGLFLVFAAISILVGIFSAVCMWKIFTKAGQPGWKSLIPVYNTYIMILIGGNPGWWLLLFFIPYVNIVISIMMMEAFVRAYGRYGIGPVLMMMFLGVFYMPYLAFSKEVRYIGAYQAHGPQYGYGNGPQYASGYGPQYGSGNSSPYGPQYAPGNVAPYEPQSGYPNMQQYGPRNVQQYGPQSGYPNMQQYGPQNVQQYGPQSGPQYNQQNGLQYTPVYDPQYGTYGDPQNVQQDEPKLPPSVDENPAEKPDRSIE